MPHNIFSQSLQIVWPFLSVWHYLKSTRSRQKSVDVRIDEAPPIPEKCDQNLQSKNKSLKDKIAKLCKSFMRWYQNNAYDVHECVCHIALKSKFQNSKRLNIPLEKRKAGWEYVWYESFVKPCIGSIYDMKSLSVVDFLQALLVMCTNRLI